ncbi:GTP-binding protein 10-like [Watersipora subatra]|uniref:GTP-binding protein 10-like n=1 Tax=Watersipora subatra TaxID=2589382 RepID=UPI00355BD88D
MVILTKHLLAVPRGLSRKSKFVDRVRVYVKGGSGGQGYPKYGGLGGDGGHVIFTAVNKDSLYSFVNDNPNRRFIAKQGKNAKRMMLLGDNGEDLVVEVPVGVTISLDNGVELADLDEPQQKFVAAKGGCGGGPDNGFKPEKGQARSVRVDLKLLADVGLVGFPNAGKSTFLSAVSRAKPKVADYPFTTLRPQLGISFYDDGRRISIADLPGLIEGAHRNIGMGHNFLKHVERTKILLVVVDVNGFVLDGRSQFRDAFETVILLNKELELYKPALLDKPQILVINKMDTPGASEKYDRTLEMVTKAHEHMLKIPEELRPTRLFEFKSILPMSAAERFNIEEVKASLRETIEEAYAEDSYEMQDTLQQFVQFSNTELADTKVT